MLLLLLMMMMMNYDTFEIFFHDPGPIDRITQCGDVDHCCMQCAATYLTGFVPLLFRESKACSHPMVVEVKTLCAL